MTTANSSPRDSFLLVTLDGFSLRRKSAGATDWVEVRLGEKCCVLVAYLALVQAPVPRRLICGMLWEGADGARARNSLRQAIFRIRRVLGNRAMLETPEGVMLSHGIVEVDLLRAIDGPDRTAILDEVGPGLAESFGHASRPIGAVFEEWRNRIRRQLAQGEFRVAVPAQPTSDSGSGLGLLAAQHPELPSLQRLEQLYRLSSHGIPVTVWVTGRPVSDLRRAVDEFAAGCRLQGACVANIARRPGAGYARSALERDLAEVIWPLPGAAGVRPEHHAALERTSKGFPVEPGLLRAATLDLIAAVAGNAPLVVTLGNPGRYSLGALSSLVSDLAAFRDRAVMLVVAEHSGVRPVHSLCIEVPLTGLTGPKGLTATGGDRLRPPAASPPEGLGVRPTH